MAAVERLTDRRAALAGYLQEVAATSFVWGLVDCLMQPADWALSLTGTDPAAPWRGTYADEAGARDILEAAGGLVALMASALEPRGWIRVEDPAPGDIGALEMPTVDGPQLVGGVKTERFWSVRGRTGLGLVSARCLAAWTWPGE